MKHKIIYNNLELIVEEKDNKVIKYLGSNILKDLLSKYFKLPVNTPTLETYEEDSIFVNSCKILKPGDYYYVTSVLSNIIRNKLGADIEYNI